MDIYVHFQEPVNNKVEIRYFGSSFLEHTAHYNLFTHFVDLTKDLNSTRLYQILMDGSSVNETFYN